MKMPTADSRTRPVELTVVTLSYHAQSGIPCPSAIKIRRLCGALRHMVHATVLVINFVISVICYCSRIQNLQESIYTWNGKHLSPTHGFTPNISLAL